MLKKLIIAEDPLSPETWETVEVESICAELASRFDTFPDTAKIYHESVAECNDVTPANETDIQRLEGLEGTFYVVLYAGELTTLAYVAISLIIAAIAIASVDIPDIPAPMARQQDNSSPNNELSGRKNRARVNGRIPDMYGTNRSYPDLIAPNYTVYENNLEVEHSLMCIGKGAFEIPESEVKEGTTTATQITDSTVEIYAPGVNPNPASTPQLLIGDRVTESFLSTDRNGGVNGQTLNPEPEDFTLVGDGDIGFLANYRTDGNHEYYIENNGGINFLNFVSTGSQIQVIDNTYTLRKLDLSNPVGPGVTFTVRVSVVSETGLYATSIRMVGAGIINFMATIKLEGFDLTYNGVTYNLDGVYTGEAGALAASFGLDDPELVNPVWNDLYAAVPPALNQAADTGATVYIQTEDVLADVTGVYEVGVVDEERIYLHDADEVSDSWADILLQQRGVLNPLIFRSPTLENLTGSAVGPFLLEDPETESVVVNFGALQGLYTDDGTTQSAINVQVRVTVTHTDANGDPTGVVQQLSVVVGGSSVTKSPRYTTGEIKLSTPGRCTVSCVRLTDLQTGFTGQVVEEIKWVDLYGAKSIDSLDFGDVTTVRTKARATAGATSAESRELNMQVTRKIPQRISGSDFTTELYPTNRADEIISAICLDPRIGNRSKSEIDFDNIYQTVADIEAYFGTELAAEFNYTFDSDNLSFEETISSVARAIFCTVYRRGNLIQLGFEAKTENSTLLFNHRNKLPGTETRTVRFGNQDGVDGVEFEYVDPSDGSIQTLYLPEDQSSINPRKLDFPGIRSTVQAHFHANRIWNKVRYQHILTEFTATHEADLLVLGDRILVADNTRPNIQDGQVQAQFGLSLTLSQKVDLSGGGEYVIFLQYSDGTVDPIGVTAGAESYDVVLAKAPTQALSLDPDNYAQTTYLIVMDPGTSTNAFLVSEKSPDTNYTSVVTAINYDGRYYDNDTDFKTGTIDATGNTI